MWKNKLLLIGFGIFIVIALIIALFSNKTEVKPIEVPAEKVVIPTKDPTPMTSDTGAKEVSQTDQEYKVDQLIIDLRNKCPINNESFLIDYDYGPDQFVVIIKKNKLENKQVFEKYMSDTGYNLIPANWFVYREDATK